MIINFVIPAPGSSYGNIIRSIIDPITIHLSEYKISQKSLPDAVNVHFFIEKTYYQMVNFGPGVNIYIDHGIGDKNYYKNLLNFIQKYDVICVSGPRWAQKMLHLGVPNEKLVTIGYAKLDPIFNGQIKKKTSEKKLVLWAPSHSNCHSSYPDFEHWIDKFPKDLEVITSVHPYNKENKLPVLKELVDADVIISDVSSIVYEAWAVGKPVVFPDWLIKEKILQFYKGSFEEKIFSENIGFHADDFNQLIDQVYYAIHHGIDKNAKDFIEGILPADYRGESGKIAAKYLLRIACKQ